MVITKFYIVFLQEIRVFMSLYFDCLLFIRIK